MADASGDGELQEEDAEQMWEEAMAAHDASGDEELQEGEPGDAHDASGDEELQEGEPGDNEVGEYLRSIEGAAPKSAAKWKPKSRGKYCVGANGGEPRYRRRGRL